MAKLTRKQLLKAGGVGAVALAATAATGSTAKASGDKKEVAVHIHGVLRLVADPSVTLPVSIDAAGTRNNLAGSGWDSGTAAGSTTMVPNANVTGACYYTVAGHIDDDVVRLRGRSLFTNRPVDREEGGARSDTRADGRLVEVTADLETGQIHWSLGGAAFSGTGVVTEIH